ncbi:MAG: QueT transporter family protein [Clostridia bacterium]|nr:QueT transporter family protein [Clostridia bacterium]
MKANKKNRGALMIAVAAVIAALYVVLTLLSQAVGLLSFDVQLRFSEALCVLPFFTSSAVPGLALGCVLANILTGCAPWDVVFGSLATLIGAIGCFFISKTLKKRGRETLAMILSPIPNIIANTAILPFVISWVYESPIPIPLLAVYVFLGEIASCALGIPLAFALNRRKGSVFGDGE